MRGLIARRSATHSLAQTRSWIDYVDICVTILANITVIGALIIAWLTFQSQQEQSQRDASYRIISGFNSSDLLAAQRRFSTEFQRLPLSSLEGRAIPRATMATLIGQLVETSVNQAELIQDIITIVGYLDDAAVCVETDTCDPDVLSAHIGETAGRYACTLMPYIEDIRSALLLDGLGEPLAAFIGYENRC